MVYGLKALLDGGLSPNAKDKTFDKPIIFQSIKAKNTETLKVMLDYGANVNTVNSLGSTLLFEAFDYHSYDHVFLLLERGANPEIRADNWLDDGESITKDVKFTWEK